MDNFNGNNGYTGNQYVMNENNGYTGNQYMINGNNIYTDNQYVVNGNNVYTDNQYVMNGNNKKRNPIVSRFFNASAILGVISSILIFVSVFLNAIDLSYFHEDINKQYNLIKMCERISDFVSDIWAGIPVGIIIGAVLMLVLSFIKLPLLKLVPCFIEIAMIVIMLVDMGNVISFIQNVLEISSLETTVTVNTAGVFHSMCAGIYVLAVGLITGLLSCFMPTPE